jgi:hypothetical protein
LAAFVGLGFPRRLFFLFCAFADERGCEFLVKGEEKFDALAVGTEGFGAVAFLDGAVQFKAATVVARLVAARGSDRTRVVSGLPSRTNVVNWVMSGGKARLVTWFARRSI